jgi:hypothetical protein
MALPAPRVWTDGEDPVNTPSADDYNLDWHDSFDFLIGNSRPFIYVQSQTAQTLTANVFITINWTVELAKRGGMLHTANSANLTVPYTGRYAGFCQGAVGSQASVGARIVCVVAVNSVGYARWDQGTLTTGGHELAASLTLDLVANDVVTLQIRSPLASTTPTAGLNCPRIALWYSGDGA